MQLTKNFKLQEFVPKATYEKYGANAKWYITQTIVDIAQEMADILEELYPNSYITINNWHSGGPRQYSGYRPPDADSRNKKLNFKGAFESQHKFGRAIDIQCFKKGGIQIPSKEVNKIIFDNEKRLMAKGLTTVENFEFTNGWVHADCRWTGLPNILVVNP